MQGLITLEGGIALALGANVGTCMTAALASLGKPREAVRVAVAHVTFKIVGVLLIVAFIPQLAELVRAISPAADTTLTGADRLAAETPRQIANAHTVFNVGIALVFLPAAGLFARFCEWVVPDRPLEPGRLVRPRYLDDSLVETPALALERVRLEIGEVGTRVNAMLGRIMPSVLHGDRATLVAIAAMDDEVDLLHGEIVRYLGRLSGKELGDEQMTQFIALLGAADNLENIGDLIETDLVELGEARGEAQLHVSAETEAMLLEFHAPVARALATAITAVVEHDEAAARAVIDAKAEIGRIADAAAVHQSRRLGAQEPHRVSTYKVEVEIIEKLKRIYYFAKRMAKGVIAEPRSAES